MERQFYINWPALVAEAKQRRRAQKLTQASLAELAGVSTPTISHFENGKKDIQLSTALNILTVLGLHDQRNLVFPDPDERYDSTRRAILFSGNDRGRLIKCVMSREALEDHFAGDKKDLLAVFKAHRAIIEQRARRKYLANKSEADGSILLKTGDFG